MRRFLSVALFSITTFCAFPQGANWTSLNGPYGADMRDIAVDPSGNIFALPNGSTNIFRSTDNGATWTSLAGPSLDPYVNDLEIDASGKIYAVSYQSLHSSTDQGASWTTLNSSTSFYGASIIRKSGSNLFVLGYGNDNNLQGVFKSTNEGTSFSRVYSLSDNTKTIYEMLINANGEVVLKASGGLGIIRSAAGGGSGYLASNTGITTASLGNYSNGQGLIMNAAGTLFAVFDDNVFKSTNDGANWAAINKPGAETGFSNSVLAATPSGTGLFISINNGHTYYSSDGGATASWVAKADLNNVRRIYVKDASNLLAGSNKGISVSANGAASWDDSNSGLAGYTFNDMVLYNNATLVVAPSARLFTGDLTGNWNVNSTAEMVNTQISDLLYLPNGNIFAFVYGCYKSTDGGNVWTNVTVPANFTEGDSYDGTTIYARNGNTFYKTTDYGTNWGSPLAFTGMPTSYYVNNFAVSAGSLFLYLRNYDVGGSPNELWKVNQTTLAATKITAISFFNTNLQKQIWARNGKIYFYSRALVGSSYQLSTSTDDGVTWSTQSVPLSNRFLLANNGYPVLGYYNGAIYFSRDDGANWISLPVSYANLANNMQLKTALVDANGYLYVQLDSYGVIKSAKPIVLPNAPTSLTNVGSSHNRISLVWNDNSNNEKYFVVEASIGDNTHYDSAAVKDVSAFNGTTAITKTSFQFAGLTPGATYYLRVKAVNDAGESVYSNEVSATMLTKCAAAIPDNRSWTGNTQNQSGRGTFQNTAIGIRYLGNGEYSISDFTCGVYAGLGGQLNTTVMSGNFTENCGVTHLYAGTNSGSSKIISNGTSTFNSGNNTLTLKWQTDPRFATIAGGLFSETVVLTLNTSDPAPATPTNVNAFVYDDTGIMVQWSAGYYHKTYTVERSTSPTFASGNSTVGTVDYPNLNIIDRGITFVNNTTYYYRVKVANGNSSPLVSGYSSIVPATYRKPYFTPQATVPQVLDAAIARLSAAVIDFDNDGNEDLYMASNGNVEPSAIMRNKGDGTFEKVLTNLPSGTFVNSSWADFNNDGKIDFAGTRQDNSTGQAQVEIFSGNGDGTFTKVSGIPAYKYYFSSTFTWLDYNKDGKLDLLFGLHNQVDAANFYMDVRLHLLRNDGNNAFTDQILLDLGVGSIFLDDVKPADYDNDGDQDLLVTGSNVDGSKNYRMLQNDGSGNFSTVSIPSLNINTQETYSILWADIDNDGDLDLFMTHPNTGSNALFKNNGNGSFTHMSSDPTSNTVATSWGGCFGDIDNDGDLDLFVGTSAASVNDPQLLFTNDGSGNFTQVTGEFATNYFRNNTTSAFGDFNKDGFLDLATGYPDRDNTILKNNKKTATTGNWSEIRLVGTVSNRNAIGAEVSLTAVGKTAIRDIQSNTGPAYNGQNSFIAHFGLGNANAITSITITWPSGIVQTLNAPPINQILTVVEDNTGPVLSTLFPANGATGVATSTNLEITLTEDATPVTAVAGKNLLLYKSTDLSTPVATVPVTSLAQAGNKFTYDPAADLEQFISYAVAIEAGAFVDIYGNASLALESSGWSFTTIDNLAPVIKYALVTTVDKGFSSQTFSPDITDNTAVAGAEMWYRKVSAKDFTKMDGTKGTGTKWDFAAESGFFDEMGIHYYFTARDVSGNSTRLPADPGKYFVTRVNYPASAPPKLSALKGNGDLAGYHIISIPLEISNKDIAANFEELGAGDKKKYRFLRYHQNPSPGWDEYPGTLSSFARGEGYFINIRDVSFPTLDNISLQAGTTPRENRDSLFTISLKKGWNQIGNPYLTAIQWNDVIAYNGLTGVSKVMLYAGGSYNTAADPGVIAPFTGGFVQADNDVSNLKIPFQGQTSGGRLTNTKFSRAPGDESWEVNFALRQEDMEFLVGSVGMTREASVGKDFFDMPVPPPLDDNQIEMSVSHPEHFMKRFARDVVDTRDEYMWEFNVRATLNSSALLTWDNSEFGSGSKDLFLFDVVQQRLIDMRDENSYSFSPRESNRFRIFFGNDLKNKIMPERIQLGNAFPNPTAGTSVIPFTLPENTGGYQVKLEVFDLMGQKVGTLAEGNYLPGFYSKEWNANESNLNSGLYTYRLVVSGQNVKEVHSGKVVLKK